MTVPAYALRELDKLVDTLRSFEVLMVITRDHSGEPRARPMVLLEVGDDACLSLMAARQSSLVEEIADEPQTLIVGQGPRQFVSLRGVITPHAPSHALELRRMLRLRRWLGRSVPKADELVGLSFAPTFGEYWLLPGLKSVRYLLEATRSWMDRQASRDDLVEHARIQVPRATGEGHHA